MNWTPRKYRAGKPLHGSDRGHNYRTWWTRFDNANPADRRLMLLGKYHPDRQ